jgi:capsular exopolysaccharide synthesis family protein
MKTLDSADVSAGNGHMPAPTPAPAAETASLLPVLSSPPGLDTAWHILRRRWQRILALGLTAALVGAAVAWCLTSGKYSTSALVYLSSRNPRTGAAEGEEFANFQCTQMATLKSYDVLSRLIVLPEIRELSEVLQHEGAELEWLQKEIVVDSQLGPEILRVTLTGDNAEDVAKILNALVAIYKEKYDSELHKQIARLETGERDAAALKDGPGADRKPLEMQHMDLQQTNTVLQTRIAYLQSELKKCEADRADLERRKRNREALVDSYEVMREVNQSDAIRPLRELSLQKEVEIARWLRLSANGAQPAVEKLKSEKAAYDKEIQARSAAVAREVREVLERRAVLKLDDEIAAADKNLKLCRDELESLETKSKINAAALADVRWQMFNQRTRAERPGAAPPAKELVDQKLAGPQANESEPSRVEIKERAPVPATRSFDRKLKFAGGTGLALFGFAVLGVFLVEFNERRIYTRHEITRGLGLKVVGSLPYLRAGADPSATVESADALRTVLLQAARHDGVRVVMVTSAVTGEGKTSLACQLAASLGRGGRRTLLIDADLRHSAAHGRFDLPPAPGFAEALRGEIDPDDAIRPTKVANLSLLPAGRCDPAALEALAQDEVQTLFFDLKEQYEFVLLDVGPVLPVADAVVIGQHADAVLLSVLRDVSKLPQVYEAQQRLAALGIRMLGAVVSGERGWTYGSRTSPAPKK